MELLHFSHEHPLKLIDEVQMDEGDEKILCGGCRESILGAAFTCTECKYILHKKCAELPKEIKHSMHHEHPLSLLSHPPYFSSTCDCDVCKITDWKWFTYNCSVCQFDVHVSCALEESVIEHEGHGHPLTFVERLALFRCDACDTEEKDFSYRCTTCSFWIHKTCAKLPKTITRSYDKHPLILTYSLPDIHRNFQHLCHICNKKVHLSYWMYYCNLCRYFVHLKCATIEKEPFMLRGSQNTEEYLDSEIMNFPLPDKSMDVISRFVKSISLEAVNDIARELIHSNHDHPLILLDDQTDDAEMIKKEIQCDG